MAEIRFCSSLHCVQNLNSGFLKIISSKIGKVRDKNENKQRIIKRKHKNANTRNGQRREHVWIPNDKKTKRKIKQRI